MGVVDKGKHWKSADERREKVIYLYVTPKEHADIHAGAPPGKFAEWAREALKKAAEEAPHPQARTRARAAAAAVVSHVAKHQKNARVRPRKRKAA